MRVCVVCPMLSMYACVVAERWLEKVKNVDGVGTCVLCKLDHQLHRRSTNKLAVNCLESVSLPCLPRHAGWQRKPTRPIRLLHVSLGTSTKYSLLECGTVCT